MRIALVNPPVPNLYVHGIDEPLNLQYLAAQVRGRHEVLIVDSFSNRTSVEETIRILIEMDADVVGVSLVFTTAYQTSLDLCRRVKELKPGVRTILGGNTATFLADQLARLPFVDVVVTGEADLSFPVLIASLEESRPLAQVPGITYSYGHHVASTPRLPLVKDLDVLPFPARDLLPYGRNYPRSVLSARGCAYGCSYCSTAAFWGNSFRMRSVDNIMAEIAAIVTDQVKPYFSFADDCFTLIPKRASEISRRIAALPFGVSWSCTGRIETMSDNLIDTLAECGCHSIFFGVESGSNKVLQSLGRCYSPQQVLQVYHRCLARGIRPYFSFIIGLPGETRVDVAKTFQLISKLEGVENGVHMLTPFPGTPISLDPDRHGLTFRDFQTSDLDINTRSFVATEHLSPEEIEDLFHKAVGYSLKALRKTRALQEVLLCRSSGAGPGNVERGSGDWKGIISHA